MADFTFKLSDYSNLCKGAVDEASQKGLFACGATAERYAKENETAVDTGRLRNSITHEETDKYTVIGTNVEYAPYIEFGTAKNSNGLHYLQKAIEEHQMEYSDLLKGAFDSMK